MCQYLESRGEGSKGEIARVSPRDERKKCSRRYRGTGLLAHPATLYMPAQWPRQFAALNANDTVPCDIAVPCRGSQLTARDSFDLISRRRVFSPRTRHSYIVIRLRAIIYDRSSLIPMSQEIIVFIDISVALTSRG